MPWVLGSWNEYKRSERNIKHKHDWEAQTIEYDGYQSKTVWKVDEGVDIN